MLLSLSFSPEPLNSGKHFMSAEDLGVNTCLVCKLRSMQEEKPCDACCYIGDVD